MIYNLIEMDSDQKPLLLGEVAAWPTERVYFLPSHPLSWELSQRESLGFG
jgi:hypothetical protein